MQSLEKDLEETRESTLVILAESEDLRLHMLDLEDAVSREETKRFAVKKKPAKKKKK